ncbi:hypothetical protein E2320_004622, partial [Naja naja]
MASTVSAYVQKFMVDVSVLKTFVIRANEKPWMSQEVCAMLKVRYTAFKSYDVGALRIARADLRHAQIIKQADSQKVQNFFQYPMDPRCMWRGIQVFTDYKAASLTCKGDTDSLNKL